MYTVQTRRDVYRTGVQGVYSTGVQGCLQDWSAWVYTVQVCRGVYSSGMHRCVQYLGIGDAVYEIART